MAPRTSGSPCQGKARELNAPDLAPGGNSKQKTNLYLSCRSESSKLKLDCISNGTALITLKIISFYVYPINVKTDNT